MSIVRRRDGQPAEVRLTFADRPAVTGLERDLVDECIADAEAMGAKVELIGQRKAKGSGTTEGVTDVLVFASGRVVVVELKRLGRIPSEDGKLSLKQRQRIYARLEQGIPTAVVHRREEMREIVNWCRKHSVGWPGLPCAYLDDWDRPPIR